METQKIYEYFIEDKSRIVLLILFLIMWAFVGKYVVGFAMLVFIIYIIIKHYQEKNEKKE